MRNPLKISIAGAGIAGLASAALLARQGHRVTVYDQFPAPRPVGSGLMIQPIGLAVLARLGLDARARMASSPIRQVLGLTDDGRRILDLAYSSLKPNASGYAIQRAALFDMLLNAAQKAGADLVAGTVITSAEQDAYGAWLVAEGDALPRADVVLDCLGASSSLCPKPSRPLRYGALWGLLDWPNNASFQSDRLEQRYRAASEMAGVLPVGVDGEDTPKVTFFWSLRGRDHADWRHKPLDEWKRDVSALWPQTKPILDQIRSHDDLIFTQYTHRTLFNPGNGRIAHLGDSFHATSPQLGQGANMALLDAAALTDALSHYSEPVMAIKDYVSRRRLHVWVYQAISWFFTPFYQSDSSVLPWIRNTMLAPISFRWPMPPILARMIAGELVWTGADLDQSKNIDG